MTKFALFSIDASSSSCISVDGDFKCLTRVTCDMGRFFFFILRLLRISVFIDASITKAVTFPKVLDPAVKMYCSMAQQRLLNRLWFGSADIVAMVRMKGVIKDSSYDGVSLHSLNDCLQRAFESKPKMVALSINSPGGSPVQSALICQRVRDLSKEHGIEVSAFVEDCGASGGYWLALAGDKVYADACSIVGSIGVISAGFVSSRSCARRRKYLEY